jgi:hypothetical protein
VLDGLDYGFYEMSFTWSIVRGVELCLDSFGGQKRNKVNRQQIFHQRIANLILNKVNIAVSLYWRTIDMRTAAEQNATDSKD